MRIISKGRMLALCLLAVPGGGAAQAQEDRDAGVYTVPSRMCGPHFLVPLTLPSRSEGESRELHFLFDSGASVSFIDPDAAERVSGRKVKAGSRVALIDAKAGPLNFARLTASAREMDHLSRALGEPFDGILGFSAFRDFLLTLDYPNGRMTVSRGSLPPPDGREVFDARGPDERPWVEARLGERKHRLLVDSGYSSTLALRAKNDMEWRAEPKPVRAFMRLRSFELREAGRLAGELRLGAHRLSEPLVYLTPFETELLGAQILRHFAVTFDQRHRRVRLRRAAREAIATPPLSGTGAVLRPRTDGLQVLTVLKGSPAEAAGLRAGDLIVTADGREATRRGCPVDAETQAGSVVTYEVKRGREVVEIMVRRDVLVE